MSNRKATQYPSLVLPKQHVLELKINRRRKIRWNIDEIFCTQREKFMTQAHLVYLSRRWLKKMTKKWETSYWLREGGILIKHFVDEPNDRNLMFSFQFPNRRINKDLMATKSSPWKHTRADFNEITFFMVSLKTTFELLVLVLKISTIKLKLLRSSWLSRNNFPLGLKITFTA